MTRLLSISSSRADIGILAPVWRAFAAGQDNELHVLLTGMHMGDDTAAREAAPESARVECLGADLAGGTAATAAAAMAEIARHTGSMLDAVGADAVMVVGDRLDMVPAALAALPYNVPIVHLMSGDTTPWAIDERARHAMTKMAHLHLTADAAAAARVCRMGEEPWRISVTGNPSLDALLEAPAIDPDRFALDLGLKSADGLRLVTVHPETNAPDPAAPMRAVLQALEKRPGPTLFTAVNADPGGAPMQAMMEAFVDRHAWAISVDTLGVRRYAGAVRNARMLIGNSSSGVIEASLLGTPVVNVGRRQEGRVSADSVLHCANDAAAVIAAIDRVTDGDIEIRTFSPYGDGRSGHRVASVLAALPSRERLLAKRFYESGVPQFDVPWSTA